MQAVVDEVNSFRFRAQSLEEGLAVLAIRPICPRAIPRSVTWCRAPVEDSEQRAESKIPSKERKASSRGWRGIGGPPSLRDEHYSYDSYSTSSTTSRTAKITNEGQKVSRRGWRGITRIGYRHLFCLATSRIPGRRLKRAVRPRVLPAV